MERYLRLVRRRGIHLIVFVVAVAFLHAILAAAIGGDSLGFDAQRWQEVAETVLRGETPYVDAPDNKPPTWLLLATFAEATGSYSVFMLAIVAVSNIAIVLFVYTVVAETYDVIPALVSALVAAELLLSSTLFINNKSLAVAISLVAVSVHAPARAGLLAGIAASVAQHSGAVVPLIAVYRWLQSDWGGRSVVVCCAVSVGAFLVQYAVVGAIWGGDALIAALDQSVGSILPYLSGGGRFPNEGSIAESPLFLLEYRSQFVLRHMVAFVASGVGGTWAVIRGGTDEKFWVWWVIIFGPMLGLAWYDHYVALLTPGLAVLAGLTAAALR